LLDVWLTGPAGCDRLVLHAGGCSACRDSPQLAVDLPAGNFEIVLTSKPSLGTLTVYTLE
jgi:hypothetical protein